MQRQGGREEREGEKEGDRAIDMLKVTFCLQLDYASQSFQQFPEAPKTSPSARISIPTMSLVRRYFVHNITICKKERKPWIPKARIRQKFEGLSKFRLVQVRDSENILVLNQLETSAASSQRSLWSHLPHCFFFFLEF